MFSWTACIFKNIWILYFIYFFLLTRQITEQWIIGQSNHWIYSVFINSLRLEVIQEVSELRQYMLSIAIVLFVWIFKHFWIANTHQEALLEDSPCGTQSFRKLVKQDHFYFSLLWAASIGLLHLNKFNKSS